VITQELEMIDGIPKSEEGPFSETDTNEPTTYHWRIVMRPASWRPPTDVFESDDTAFVRVEVAGMQEEDFSIELNGRELTIRGIRQDTAERRAFHQMEIRFGEFAFVVELPLYIDPNQVQAVYENGFLLVSLPKAHPRQIRIRE